MNEEVAPAVDIEDLVDAEEKEWTTVKHGLQLKHKQQLKDQLSKQQQGLQNSQFSALSDNKDDLYEPEEEKDEDLLIV